MAELFVGLMSGTSLDGIDAVLVRIEAGGAAIEVLAHRHQGFDPALAAELLALNGSSADELHRAALAANGVARAYAAVTAELLEHAGVAPAAVRAIGAHGQTVRHRPGAVDGVGYTIQLLNGALLAELAGVDVAADFRSRDVAAGGQGAPLVPAFHRAVFGRPGLAVGVVNLGGISNLTALDASGGTRGFDCGPGNVLLDLWIQRHRCLAYDAGGAWAASGRPIEPLLAQLLAEPFFAQPPPRSTGRDLFNGPWLDAMLQRAAVGPDPAPADVQATLAELTARCVVDSVRRTVPDAVELIVCGGGARNADLLRRLGTGLGRPVVASEARGLPATQVEACAFAWLAQALVERRPANLPAATGARGPRVLGALHPGR